MRKIKAATTAAALAVVAVGVPMAVAAPASAASSGVAKCVTATWYPSKNAVNIHNGCKNTIKVQVDERWWWDSSCITIKPGKSHYYKGTGTVRSIKYC
ncbi:hypothetical protein CP973_13980 [Streptomyces albofaciens JCM 4342]|uniref:hypothetical protein n=1 Tax=Streptomyces albofaciens TaxID=66866 RepID=UPI00123BBAC5|nr:hypothetical protein [Streptomyces albofaciens]KAA6222884.1 hypothetical protein CP973_13980 [Streptomyces albofaciens JCM 4342]